MKHLLLGLLEAGPAYGLELKARRDALVGLVSGSVNVGQIYVTLGRMEKDGLVRHHVEASDVGPDRKVYELTEVGAKELQRWLESPPAPAQLRSEALTKVITAMQIGSPQTAELVRTHRGQCLEALRALDLAAAAGDRASAVDDVLVQAAALHLQADLRWLDHVESLLASLPETAPGPPSSSHQESFR